MDQPQEIPHFEEFIDKLLEDSESNEMLSNFQFETLLEASQLFISDLSFHVGNIYPGSKKLPHIKTILYNKLMTYFNDKSEWYEIWEKELTEEFLDKYSADSLERRLDESEEFERLRSEEREIYELKKIIILLLG